MEPVPAPQVYPGYTQAELDLAYSQRHWAENADQILGRWSSAVDAVEESWRLRTPGGPGDIRSRERPARYDADRKHVRAVEAACQCDLLRCLFANPFRPAPAIDPAWLAWRGRVVQELASASGDRFTDLVEREHMLLACLGPEQHQVLADLLRTLLVPFDEET